MPVQIQYFDDVRLMEYNPTQDHSPSPGASAFLNSIGGTVDLHGANATRAQAQTIPVTGIVWGETTYVVDGAGDDGPFDPDAEYWIMGDGPTMLRSGVQALRDKVRKQGTLWRERLDYSGVREWKTARMLRMSQPQTLGDRVFKAHVTCEFESLMTNWHSALATTYSVFATNNVDASLLVENPGATVYDAVLTVTLTSGTITSLAVTCTDLGIQWTWAGSIGNGEVLTVDAAARTMTVNGDDAYALTLTAGHSVAGWFPIDEGMYTFTVQVDGGDAVIALSFFSQFP